MTDPEQLVDYERKAAQAERRAERVRAGLAAIRVTERTSDGRVAVTVNASGNMVDLRLAPQEKAGPDLAQDIMRTLRRAQSRIVDAVKIGLADAGAETLAELTRQYSTAYPNEDPAERRRHTLRLGNPPEQEKPATQQARRDRAASADAEPDYGDRNLLR